MTGSATIPGFRRHGLYYPYFHVRDERWIKVAALYWPKWYGLSLINTALGTHPRYVL